MTLILFNKPYRVLSQFTDTAGRETLADFIRTAGVYPAGRLDYDSEGLLLLTDDAWLQTRVAEPRYKLPKTYWVQVEGRVSPAALQELRAGVRLRDGKARALEAAAVSEPAGLWPRNPPIRFRRHVPDSWLCLSIAEGRNRQVRRMCAAVGLPALRLIRCRVGPWELGQMQPGELSTISDEKARAALGGRKPALRPSRRGARRRRGDRR